MNTSAPSGLNGLTRTVWTEVTHLQRFGSVGKRITRSRARFSTVSTAVERQRWRGWATVTADKRATLWLLDVIAVYRHRAGCGTSPDARYGATVARRYTFLSQNTFSARGVKRGRNRLIYESDGGMRAVLRVFEHLSARGGPCGRGTVAISAARSTEAAWWRPVGYTLAPRAALRAALRGCG